METIHITHNPFLIETEFLINGQAPAAGSKINAFSKKRLQLWVEQIFDELVELFNGCKQFQVEFKGVQADFEDVKEAAEKATAKGLEIELSYTLVEGAQERLTKITEFMTRLRYESEKFASYLEQSDQNAKKDFEEALDNDFDAYVVATMSSGKSTFINALLGQDLLPAANQATTATIAKIYDDKEVGDTFIGERFDRTGQLVEKVEEVDREILQKWNSDKETKTIELHGNIRAVKENANIRLVLTDTPGPNNAQDAEHQRTTLGYIQDSARNPLIVYVLNATQLGINDDQQLLRLVADTMEKGGKQSRDRFLFVINKMDEFDPEKGESVEKALENVKAYLEKNGIVDPIMYPVSARMAYLLRRQGSLTRSERNDKACMADLLLEEPSMAMPQYMRVSSSVRQAMEDKAKNDPALVDATLAEALLNSGITGVEAVIDEYIAKYSFPMRLNRAHLAMKAALEEGLQEAELNKQLDMNEKELEQLKAQIQDLMQRREQGFNTAAYQETLRTERPDLPGEVQVQLDEAEARVLQHIADLGRTYKGEASESEASAKLDRSAQDIQFEFNRVINEYERAFKRSQELTKERLHEEYLQQVKALFPDSSSLNLPAFKVLKKSIDDFSLNIELHSNEIQTKDVVVDSYTVSDFTWWKPWTWGDTRTVEVKEEQSYVDLHDLWKTRVINIRSQFSTLKSGAIERIESDIQKLVDNYLAFLDNEFAPKFNALLADLEHKIEHTEERKEAIARAEEEIAEIEGIKRELDSILQI
ncbi:dynamin family protein [Salinibius halmophilus]|uniref:dynamin family protein n=1 Tax=Salinibius halmophilus TaxID=1853216 RepID=UPI000E67322E|nr:dynamin family protein [Salinibius halmophilus]